MAYIVNEHCNRCNGVTMHTNDKCNVCSTKEANEKERMWEAQDMDIKITNLRKRVECLERNPIRF